MTSPDTEYQHGIKALQGGYFGEAECFFRKAIDIDVDHYDSWNLLGLTYQLQKNWEQCLEAWKEALRCKPDSTDTMLNLGIACIACERPSEAEKYWTNIIALEPNNIRCLINLGLYYREREINQKAHDMWAHAYNLMPQNANVQEWLADVKGLLGMQKIVHQQWDEAEDLLIDAVALDPEYAVLWGYLSELHFQKQEYQKAFATCSKGLNIEPTNSTLHHTMGNILRMTHQEEQALIAYQKAIECGSKHPATYRAIAELSQSDVDENEQVIQQLFDQYADHFDSDLIHNLSYATPQKAYTLFQEFASPLPITSILDLGCGTGLSFSPFQPNTDPSALVVGVDVSEKMLTIAKEKRLYSELHAASIKEYIEREARRFSLVLCLDTLVYIRHFDELFSGISACNSPRGYFLFSTETTRASHPTLQSSGRYAHPENYVEDICIKHGWRLVKKEKSLLRKDGVHWIEGMIWLFQKPASTEE